MDFRAQPGRGRSASSGADNGRAATAIPDLYLTREAAGGGPRAERSEEPGVEGAGRRQGQAAARRRSTDAEHERLADVLAAWRSWRLGRGRSGERKRSS
jgi:hypothetical protein